MGKQFETWHDARGDVWTRNGKVICQATGTVFEVGGDGQRDGPPLSWIDRVRSWVRFASVRSNATCLGGSGNNTVLSCAVAGVPVGLFRPSEDGAWTCEDFPTAELTWYGDGSMSLHDGTDVVAQCGSTGSTIGPSGTLTATSYGRTTYHGGAAFSVTAVFEGGGTFPSAAVVISAGSAQAGIFAATAADAWQSEDDSDWTITADGSGNMTLSDGTAAVAVRTGGSNIDPSGFYATTEHGRTAWHAGADFAVEVLVAPAVPLERTVYITVTEDGSGAVASVDGPFIAASLPAPSGLVWPVPLASTGAGGPRQILEGPLLWPGHQTGGGEPDDYQTIRAITIAGL